MILTWKKDEGHLISILLNYVNNGSRLPLGNPQLKTSYPKIYYIKYTKKILLQMTIAFIKNFIYKWLNQLTKLTISREKWLFCQITGYV